MELPQVVVTLQHTRGEVKGSICWNGGAGVRDTGAGAGCVGEAAARGNGDAGDYGG